MVVVDDVSQLKKYATATKDQVINKLNQEGKHRQGGKTPTRR